MSRINIRCETNDVTQLLHDQVRDIFLPFTLDRIYHNVDHVSVTLVDETQTKKCFEKVDKSLFMGHTLHAELKMKRPQGWDAGRTDGPNKNRKRNEGGGGGRGGFRDFKDLGRSEDFKKD